MQATRFLQVAMAVFLTTMAAEAGRCAVYHTHDLGTFGYQEASARSINNSGSIVYSAGNDDEGFHIFLSTVEGTRELTLLDGSPILWPYDMNNSNTIVGTHSGNAARWTTDGGSESISGYHSNAFGVNNAGRIVGYQRLETLIDHPFLWDPLQGMIDLGWLSQTPGWAVGINNNGAVAGSYTGSDGQSHAYLWDSTSGVAEIGTLGGAWSDAHAVNNRGQVVGWSVLDDDTPAAYLWSQQDGMQIVATFQWGLEIYPYAINDSGVVVGVSPQGAFAWSASDGFTILGDGEAYDINDLGQIVGCIRNGTTYDAAIWEPVPEPSSMIALACALAAFVIRRRSC